MDRSVGSEGGVCAVVEGPTSRKEREKWGTRGGVTGAEALFVDDGYGPPEGVPFHGEGRE